MAEDLLSNLLGNVLAPKDTCWPWIAYPELPEGFSRWAFRVGHKKPRVVVFSKSAPEGRPQPWFDELIRAHGSIGAPVYVWQSDESPGPVGGVCEEEPPRDARTCQLFPCYRITSESAVALASLLRKGALILPPLVDQTSSDLVAKVRGAFMADVCFRARGARRLPPAVLLAGQLSHPYVQWYVSASKAHFRLPDAGRAAFRRAANDGWAVFEWHAAVKPSRHLAQDITDSVRHAFPLSLSRDFPGGWSKLEFHDLADDARDLPVPGRTRSPILASDDTRSDLAEWITRLRRAGDRALQSAAELLARLVPALEASDHEALRQCLFDNSSYDQANTYVYIYRSVVARRIGELLFPELLGAIDQQRRKNGVDSSALEHATEFLLRAASSDLDPAEVGSWQQKLVDRSAPRAWRRLVRWLVGGDTGEFVLDQSALDGAGRLM